MSDLIKERAMLENTYRVSMNLLVLLDIGLWPGKHAMGIEECKGMVVALRDDAVNKLHAMVPPPGAPPSAAAPVPVSPVLPVQPAATAAPTPAT